MKFTEARSHPEINLRIDPLSQLKDLRARFGPDLYVSFTLSFGHKSQRAPKGPKLGINPRSGFDTPIGVYAYPIDEVITFTEHQMRAGFAPDGGIDAPFTGYSSWKKAWVFKIDDQNVLSPNISSSQYEAGIVTLGKILGYSEEETEKFKNITYNEATIKSPGILLWEASRYASLELVDRKEGGKNTATWNALLRKLGFRAVIDPGHGFIHDNEQTQAVILDPSIIHPIDIIDRNDAYELFITKLNDRLMKNPLLLEKLPEALWNKIPLNQARVIIEDYLFNKGPEGLDRAVEFTLASPDSSTLISLFLSQDGISQEVGFKALEQNPNDLHLPRYAIASILDKTDMVLRMNWLVNVLKRFGQYGEDAGLMMYLLDHPNRIANYTTFVQYLATLSFADSSAQAVVTRAQEIIRNHTT